MGLIGKMNSKIAYKLYIPIIATILVGLLVITGNSLLNLVNLAESKHLEIRDTYQHYLKNAYENKAIVAETNAISLSQNPVIIEALKTGKRENAIEALVSLTDSFNKNTDFANTRIHIHTADLKSFIRSWRPNDYGDDLSSFRDSIHYLHQSQKPFATSEIGRAGMLIRGLAPIFDQGVLIGSIEFIGDYIYMGEMLKEAYGLEFTVLAAPSESESFERFNPSYRVGDRFLAMPEKDVYPPLLQALKDFQSKDIRQTGMLILNDLFLTSIPIKDVEENIIGCLMVANQLGHVEALIDEARYGYIEQILIVVLIDLLIFIFLVLILKRSVLVPINELTENISDLSNQFDAEGNHTPKPPINLIKRRDEIGLIARTYAKSGKQVHKLFKNLYESKKINDEYLKAVYAGSIVSKSDTKGTITFVNESLCEVTGYTPEELIGKPHNVFRHPSTPKNTFWEMWRAISKGKVWHGMLKNRRKDGTTFYANTTIVPIIDPKGRVREYIALRDDVTQLVKSQRDLRKSFLTDALTSLGNRFKLLNEIEDKQPELLAILDIKALKEINDFYGVEIGDQVIVSLSKCLFDHLKNEFCSVYRLQGDEFAVVSFKPIEELGLEEFEEKIKDVMNLVHQNHLDIEGHAIDIELTIGIAKKQEDLLMEADLAHKTAKSDNKELVVYSETLKTSQQFKNNIEWVKKIKEALKTDRIYPYYQPIINNHTKQIEKYESLMRCETTEGEIKSPFFFLDIAKKARLYSPLTDAMLKKVFQEMQVTSGEFSINLSMEDVINPDVLLNLKSQLQVTPELGERLVIEIVESETIESFDMVESFLNEIRAYGCKIAVDDFGTGYSNFEFLLNLKPDYIKIDGSLIKTLPDDEKIIPVLESIIDLAKKNGIKTIAEFVHSEEVLQAVIELGIDYSQGFYLGEPALKPQEILDKSF